MNNDLISRSALKKALREAHINMELTFGIASYGCVMEIIDNAPTVEYPFYAEAYQTGYEEAKNDRPLYKGVVFVDDYGINKVIEVDENGVITAQMVIPRDTFIEAYNKFIRGNDDEHTDNS